MKTIIQSRLKFSLLFLIIGLLPMMLVSIIATYSGSQDIKQKVYNQLTAINQIKKQGYKILVIWEQDLLKDTENAKNKILKFAKS